MTEKDIRPIPNYIMKEIYERDMKSEPWQTSMVRYYAYLTVWIKMMLVDSIRFLKINEIDYVGIGVDPYILALKEELIDFVHFCSVSSK